MPAPRVSARGSSGSRHLWHAGVVSLLLLGLLVVAAAFVSADADESLVELPNESTSGRDYNGPRRTGSAYVRPRSAGHLDELHESLREGEPSDPTAPQQVHITPGGQGEVFVVYATRDYRAQPVVRFGTAPGDLSAEARGEKRTYTTRVCPEPYAHQNPMPGPPGDELDRQAAMDLQNTSQWLPPESSGYKVVRNESDIEGFCWSYMNHNAFYESPTIHTIRLTGLAPSTTYYYSCGKHGPTSREFSFKSLPLPGPDVPLRVAVWSDVGQSNVSLITAQEMANSNADVNLLAGDLSYADGVPWRWDTFGRAMEPLFSRHLHLFCPGNHDAASGVEQSVAYTARYPTPWRSSGSTSPLWYSTDIGPMHLISLAGQYSPISRGTAQHAWLEDDLARIDRSVTPWLVAMWHVPWYNSNEKHSLEAEPMRREIEGMLVAAGVNLVFNGHVHSYERSNPVSDFRPDDCGPTHIVIGDGGNYEGPALPWKDDQPPWSAFREASFGTGLLEIQSPEKAVWRWSRGACVHKRSGMYDVWTHEANATYYVPGGDGQGACSTEADNSEMKHVPVDEVVLRQHPARCRGGRSNSNSDASAGGIGSRGAVAYA